MPPTLVQEYQELRTQALAITDQAVKESRQLSEEELAKVSGYVEQAKAKHGEIQRQQKAAGLVDQVKGLEPMQADQPDADQEEQRKAQGSFGDRFVKSEGYRALLKMYPTGLPDSADLKLPPVPLGSARRWSGGSKGLVFVGDNEGPPPASTIPGIPTDFRGMMAPFFQPLTILDVVTRSQTSGDLVEFIQEDVSARVNAAAIVPEATDTSGAGYTAAAKPESTIAWVKVSTGVKTIATWVPITTKALADVPQIRSIIDAYLTRFLDEELADQVVNGDGSGENFSGLLDQVPAASPTGTGFAALREAQAEAEEEGTPNAWLLNPADIATIDTQQDGNGRFMGSGPFGIGPRTLWGLPMITVRQLAPGTGLVGDFRQAVLYDREAATVSVGTINDQFTHNMRTLLAEERAAFGIWRPAAMRQVDFDFTTTP